MAETSATPSTTSGRRRSATIHHRQAALLLHARRRPRLRHLRPDRAGRRRRRRRVLDRLRGRRHDRGDHRHGVRRAGHEVPAGGRAALYVNKAFGNKALTFLITVSLPLRQLRGRRVAGHGFASYFADALGGPAGAAGDAAVHRRADASSTSSASPSRSSINMVMAFVEIAGLRRSSCSSASGTSPRATPTSACSPSSTTDGDQPGAGDPRRRRALVLRDDRLREHRERRRGDDRPAPVLPALPDRRHDHRRRHLRAGLDGGGAHRRRPTRSPSSDAALLEVVKSGILPLDTGFMSTLFSVIAMIAITNTTLVAVVTQPRILYGMANEDVVPGVFAKIHADPAQPVGRPALQRRSWSAPCWWSARCAPKVEGHDPDRAAGPGHRAVPALHLRAGDRLLPQAARAGRGRADLPRQHPAAGASVSSATSAILGWSVYDDPTSLSGAPASSAVGVVLFLRRVPLRHADAPARRRARRSRRRRREGESDMHVIVATDGSRSSRCAAAKQPQVLRRPDQDHRHLGGRGDPAARGGRLR